MENLKTNRDKKYCSISHTKIYSVDNDELVCLKIYQGDWGDWDETPENNKNCELNRDDV
ncbi:hypothetical protein [Flavobacterium quisquiliarum]|uniref:Uncharacterized protein n=1 Tax=Flavobacterium quisquiliarum TaxID=1834436 RepID=A0ABV8VZ84_9FLAO|nr:hypothetical protein [Flavobacterium quisquiliarum]MBW1654639.1 hypothetical protein [Flavobacterium quisquiliarum]